MNPSKWDRRFMRLAQHVAEWSKDPSTQVGAVVVDHDRRVIGMGYNGFPRGVHDTRERYIDREVKYRFVVHAEANAILNAAADTRGATMYLTAPPCCDCAKLVIQAGIQKVFYIQPTAELKSRWADELAVSEEMLNEAWVRTEEVDL